MLKVTFLLLQNRDNLGLNKSCLLHIVQFNFLN